MTNEQTITITHKHTGDVATINAYRVEYKPDFVEIRGSMPFENELTTGAYVTMTTPATTIEGMVDWQTTTIDMQGINIITRIKIS